MGTSTTMSQSPEPPAHSIRDDPCLRTHRSNSTCGISMTARSLALPTLGPADSQPQFDEIITLIRLIFASCFSFFSTCSRRLFSLNSPLCEAKGADQSHFIDPKAEVLGMEGGWPHSHSKWVQTKSEFTAGFLLPTPHACVCAKSLQSTLRTVASRLLCPGDSPGKNTGVGGHVLLQGIFPTQGSNPHLRVLYPGKLSHSTSTYRSENRSGASLLTSLSLTFPDL